MNFIQVINDCVALLEANEAGRYKTIGYQVISSSPEEAFIEGDSNFLGTVRVYHKGSQFPFGAGSRNGPVNHDITIALEFKTAAETKADLTVLEDDNALPAAIATALAEIQTAEAIANNKMDNLFSIIYEIIMDLQNKNLGSTIKIGSRWIPQYEKDDPVRFGSLVALTGGATITARVGEQLTGAAIPSQPTEKENVTNLQTSFDDLGNPVNNAEVAVTK